MKKSQTESLPTQSRDDLNDRNNIGLKNTEIGDLDWYQNFETVVDRSTNRRFDRQKTSELVFPRDMAGKSVLDIGTREGLFCFEALKRGARRALGFEINGKLVVKARKLAEILKLPAEFLQVDVESYQIKETFDDVLAFNVLNKVRNPFLLLERLIDIADERLILGVVGLGQHEQKKLKLNWWRRILFRGLQGLPIVFVNPNPRRNRQRFYLSVDAVRCFLSEHRHVFSKIEVIQSSVKDRQILIAHKRQIDNLVVVAGPTSAGKTTMIDNLTSGNEPEVADRLGIKNINEWETLDGYAIAQDNRTHLSRVIMHYDFLTRIRWNSEHSQMVEFLDIVSSARRVTFLTLWTEPERLREQFEENEIREYTRQRGKGPKSKKTLRLQKDYEDPQKIINYYRTWFAFSATLSEHHVVHSQSPSERFRSVDEWRRENS